MSSKIKFPMQYQKRLNGIKKEKLEIETMNVIDEKIGLNLKEASKMLGINEKLMSDLTKIKGFPCIKFKRRIVINKNKLQSWFDANSGKYF